jgi:hypothetical protein
MHPKWRFVEYTNINDVPTVERYNFLVIEDNEKIGRKEYQETVEKGFSKMYDAFFYAFIGFGDIWFFDKVTRNHEKAEHGKPNGNQILWCIGNASMSDNNNYCKNKF